jgi:hypothetical protein
MLRSTDLSFAEFNDHFGQKIIFVGDCILSLPFKQIRKCIVLYSYLRCQLSAIITLGESSSISI